MERGRTPSPTEPALPAARPWRARRRARAVLEALAAQLAACGATARRRDRPAPVATGAIPLGPLGAYVFASETDHLVLDVPDFVDAGLVETRLRSAGALGPLGCVEVVVGAGASLHLVEGCGGEVWRDGPPEGLLVAARVAPGGRLRLELAERVAGSAPSLLAVSIALAAGACGEVAIASLGGRARTLEVHARAADSPPTVTLLGLARGGERLSASVTGCGAETAMARVFTAGDGTALVCGPSVDDASWASCRQNPARDAASTYLRSRGLSPEEAEAILALGHLEPALSRLSPGLRAEVEARVRDACGSQPT